MDIHNQKLSLNFQQRILKRIFDFIIAIIAISFLFWLILLAWILASCETQSNGFFIQKRVGLDGKLFNLIKIKTMISSANNKTTVTCYGDPRITKIGFWFRKLKIDELPQLWNVLIGDMSFVGPRPDVPGFADLLIGDDKVLLSIRPGITGPASLKYKNEEKLLAKQENPELFNKKVIWPDKVRINIMYIRNWSLYNDLKYILRTLFYK